VRWLVASILTVALAWGVLSLIFPVAPVDIHVRWASDVTNAQLIELERRFQFRDGRQTDPRRWPRSKYLPPSA
jgi:hypothetical protein